MSKLPGIKISDATTMFSFLFSISALLFLSAASDDSLEVLRIQGRLCLLLSLFHLNAYPTVERERGDSWPDNYVRYDSQFVQSRRSEASPGSDKYCTVLHGAASCARNNGH